MEHPKEKQQMQLDNFCEEYDMPRTTIYQYIAQDGFPAYKISGRWYIDIPAFLKWREKMHRKSYKYAN